MTTTIPFPRYDLCPNCSSRINIYTENTIVEDTILDCKCGNTYSVGDILNYWTSYYISKELEDEGKNK